MRTLVVETMGPRHKTRLKPMIRLKGYWLKDAGIFPDNYVTVNNPEPGTLVIKIVEDPQTT